MYCHSCSSSPSLRSLHAHLTPQNSNLAPQKRLIFDLKTRPFRSSNLCFAASRSVLPRSKKMAEQDKDAFYLVRKGDMIGIYKTLRECQAQAASSVLDPSITVYKGYGMSKEAEAFLRSHGLRNPLYSINIEDAKDNLNGKFGALIPCPFQEPDLVGAKEDDDDSSPERWREAVDLIEMAEKTSASSRSTKPTSKSKSARPVSAVFEGEIPVASSLPKVPQNEFFDSNTSMSYNDTPSVSSSCDTCTIEFDGASKGNPGLAGAGVMLRSSDGTMVWRLREGVGVATNNVAEYRSLLLGMRHAFKVGFKHIRAQGDSKLVVMQVQGLWKTKNANMADLCGMAKELKKCFVSFQISHVLREYNSDADALANGAIHLKDGQVEVEYVKM